MLTTANFNFILEDIAYLVPYNDQLLIITKSGQQFNLNTSVMQLLLKKKFFANYDLSYEEWSHYLRSTLLRNSETIYQIPFLGNNLLLTPMGKPTDPRTPWLNLYGLQKIHFNYRDNQTHLLYYHNVSIKVPYTTKTIRAHCQKVISLLVIWVELIHKESLTDYPSFFMDNPLLQKDYLRHDTLKVYQKIKPHVNLKNFISYLLKYKHKNNKLF